MIIDTEKTPSATWRRPFKRTAWALVCAAAGMLLVALLRPVPSAQALPESVFWAKKATAAPADVVIAGDSRAYRSLSPAEMQPNCPGMRIFNYGWDSSGFGPAYLDAIDAHLDHGSALPTVILGITPWSLTARSMTQTNFLEYQRKSALELAITLKFGTFLNRFNSFISFKPELTAKGKVKAAKWGKPTRIQLFHEDGSVYSDLIPHDPENTLKRYESNFTGNPVDPQVVAGLLKQVDLWRQQGVTVYGFRPPTTRAMVELENRLGHFEEDAFVKQFVSAGGKWIEAPQYDAYDCYDGSHITGAAAAQFSRDIAQTIFTIPGLSGHRLRVIHRWRE